MLFPRIEVTVFGLLLSLSACGAAPFGCPEGQAIGTMCTSCGPVDQCVEPVTRCLPRCGDGGTCPGGLSCFDGLCKNVCI